MILQVSRVLRVLGFNGGILTLSAFFLLLGAIVTR